MAGKSYGTYQLSSRMGTLKRFIDMMGYQTDFKGIPLASTAFDNKWRELAKNPAFGEAQHEFIKRTHFQPQIDFLKRNGLDFENRGPGVLDAIWSTAVQFGPGTQLITRALAGIKNPNDLTDEQIIRAIQKRKIDNNDSFLRSSSPEVRRGTLNRANNELRSLLALNDRYIKEKEQKNS